MLTIVRPVPQALRCVLLVGDQTGADGALVFFASTVDDSLTMKTLPKPMPSEMTPEVRAMIDLRRSAEQRGHYEPLGRVLTFETAHGTIQFGTQLGEGTGPDLAICSSASLSEKDAADVVFRTMPEDRAELHKYCLLVLQAWLGLPTLRRNIQKDGQNVACPRCLHVCDVCDGTGKKQCEGLDCGGRGWVWGNWIDCPGPGCRGETGTFKGGCPECASSPIQGQVREKLVCPMCKGSKVMTCSGCRGTKKRSTGQVGGSLDWRVPACKACGGTGWKGELVAQDVGKFTNAILRCTFKTHNAVAGDYFALGPIYSFTVKDFNSNRLRIFDVTQDSGGDYLMLLVPASPRQKPQKAYLVGGVVQERMAGEAMTPLK